MSLAGLQGAETELDPYAPDLHKHEAAETAVSYTAGRTMIIRVRGGTAPKTQCVLAGEFAVGGRS
jgi:hypothetical protein